MKYVEIANRPLLTPLLVVGHEVPESFACDAGELPLYVYHHQFEGLACLQTSIFGVGLRLEDNLDVMPQSGHFLTAFLKDVGEYANETVGSLSSVSQPFYPTGAASWKSMDWDFLLGWADRYYSKESSDVDHQEWSAFLRRHLGCFPEVERAFEALIISKPSCLAVHLSTWRSLHLALRSQSPRVATASGHEVINLWDGESQDYLEVTHGPRLSELLPALYALVGTEPRIYFIWANSD